VRGGLDDLDDVAVDQPAGEAHADAAARRDRVLQLRRHGVVEEPVEVGERHVDGDAGDR
jgi:hypothetical protein